MKVEFKKTFCQLDCAHNKRLVSKFNQFLGAVSLLAITFISPTISCVMLLQNDQLPFNRRYETLRLLQCT